jgi:tetrahydromethanopterin S-methyltransferase subunit F
MASERERDIEFGRLVEAVQNLEKRMSQQRVEDQETTRALFTKIEALQEGMNRFHGAKGMAVMMISTLIAIGAAIAEWIRIGIRGH